MEVEELLLSVNGRLGTSRWILNVIIEQTTSFLFAPIYHGPTYFLRLVGPIIFLDCISCTEIFLQFWAISRIYLTQNY